jgi:hypothetical protein
MVAHRMLVGGVALALLAGCAAPAGEEPTGSASVTAPATSAPAGEPVGSLYTSLWDTEGGQITIDHRALAPDGSVAAPTQLLQAPADDSELTWVLDGIGTTALTGTFVDNWTTQLQVRDAASGAAASTVAADRWCGGEGDVGSQCTMLDATRLARTTELGAEGVTEGSVIISSLQDGSTLAEYGPFAGLTRTLAGGTEGTLLMLASDPAAASAGGGTILRLDTASGQTSELGAFPTAWEPLCALGTDSVLGFTLEGDPTAVVVGPAQVSGVTWAQGETPLGCSTDGRFLYVQHVPQPPGEDQEDTEPPNPATTVDRIALADGSRASVLTVEPSVLAGPVTR